MTKGSFLINNQAIAEHTRVFIIAEAGVNHNGQLDLALQLVDAAAEAGADAVKFQTFKASQVVTEAGEMADYQKKNLGKAESQRQMLTKLELAEEFYQPIIERCHQKKILFLSTPHGGKDSVDFLESLKMTAYKIGSGDLTNFILLEKVAKTGKPIILSSGMATLGEVKAGIEFVKSQGNTQIVMLHCTTNYPCPHNEVNLAAMVTMMKELDVPVGYSDHTEGDAVAIMAAALGMALYECHFTIDKTLPGPDHIASADPVELKQRIQAIRQHTALSEAAAQQAIESITNHQEIMGSAIKQPTASELASMEKTIRRSVVVVGDHPQGYVLTSNDLEAKRPGNGVPPSEYQYFIGKTLTRAVRHDDQLTYSDAS
jgi:N,N'-diacetyllegionaminate synthase